MKKKVLEKAFVRATKAIDRSLKRSAQNLWVECKGGFLSFAGISAGIQVLSRISLEDEVKELKEFSGKVSENLFGSLLKSIRGDVELTLSYADCLLILKTENMSIKIPVSQEENAFPISLDDWKNNAERIYSSDKIGKYVRAVAHVASQSTIEKGEYSTGQKLEFFNSGVRVICSSNRGTSVRSNVSGDGSVVFGMVLSSDTLTEAVSLFDGEIRFAIHKDDTIVLHDEKQDLFVRLQRMNMKYPKLDTLTYQFETNVYAFVPSEEILQGISLCQAIDASFMELHIAENAVSFKVKTASGDSSYTAVSKTNVNAPRTLKVCVNSQFLLNAVKSMDGGLIVFEINNTRSLFRLRDRSSDLEYLLPMRRKF